MIFGKKWNKWKSTREENRRKKAGTEGRLNRLDPEAIRDFVMNRWHSSTETHRQDGQMVRHSTPPITVPSGETWRQQDRETILSSPILQPIEVKSLSSPMEDLIRNPNLDPELDPDFTAEDRLDKGKGKAISPTSDMSSEASPPSLRLRFYPAELASPVHFAQEKCLGSRLEPTRPENPRVPDDTSSHSQWVSREVRTPNSSHQTPKDFKVQHYSEIHELDAGARSMWSAPLKPFPPPPALVSSTPTEAPEPILPTNHPILRVPSPTPNPGQPVAFNNNSGDTPSIPWTETTAPGTDYGPSKRGSRRTRKTSWVCALLGLKKQKPNTSFRPLIGGPLPSTLHATSKIPRPVVSPPPTVPFSLVPPPVPPDTRHNSHISGTMTPAPGLDRWAFLIASHGLGPSRPPASYTVSNTNSFYSSDWQDDCGGHVHYDHHGNIKDVEFEDGADVRLDLSEEASQKQS